MTCRHNHCWVIPRGLMFEEGLLWCPDCGAIRPNTKDSPCWIYPKGQEKALKLLEKNGDLI